MNQDAYSIGEDAPGPVMWHIPRAGDDVPLCGVPLQRVKRLYLPAGLGANDSVCPECLRVQRQDQVHAANQAVARARTEHELAVQTAAAAWCDQVRPHGPERWPADVCELLDRLMKDLDVDGKEQYQFVTALQQRMEHYRAFGKWA